MIEFKLMEQTQESLNLIQPVILPPQTAIGSQRRSGRGACDLLDRQREMGLRHQQPCGPSTVGLPPLSNMLMM